MAEEKPLSSERPALRDLLPVAAVVAAFAHALAVSWRKWGNLIIDGGRELELPRRMAEGETLYRDLRFYYGPLAPYVNAGLYKLFGVHLDVLVVAGVLSAALACLFLHRLARQFLERWQAAAVCGAFAYLCAFAHLYRNPSFNFVIPYTYAATYGMVAALGSVVLLIEHVRTGSRWAFAGSLLGFALAAMAKVETLFPVLCAHALFIGAQARARSPHWRWRVHGLGYAAALGAVGLVYGGLAWRVGPALWSENLGGVVNRGSSEYVLNTLGVGDLPASLKSFGLSLLALAAVLALGYAASRRVAQEQGPKRILWLCLPAAAALCAYGWLDPAVPFRALPALGVAALILVILRYRRQGEDQRQWLTQGLLWVFALACLARIPLNSAPYHYGFFLLPAGLVCTALVLCDYAPRLLRGNDEWARRVFGLCAIALLAGASFASFRLSSEMYARHNQELVTERGRLWLLASDVSGRALALLANEDRQAHLVVIPQGAGLVFFSGMRGSADGLFSYLPMELASDESDTRLRQRWAQKPPDKVLWLRQDLSEFGSRGFGVDYATRSAEWLQQKYKPVSSPQERVFLLAPKSVTPRTLAP